jgi:DNA invertase Pin-like site-specific DNA recombinase
MPELKVTADHLKRDAYLYVRQSSPRQVTEHNESTQRQYALRNRAIAAGWPVERIRVIDCDLGKSASIAPAARDGFQQLSECTSWRPPEALALRARHPS